MRRGLLPLLLALAPMLPVAAQAPRVSLSVTLSPPVTPTGGRRVRVRVSIWKAISRSQSAGREGSASEGGVQFWLRNW